MIKAKTTCHGFCCSRWIEQQEFNLNLISNPTSLTISDLDTPIHQLLAFDRFSGISRHDYHDALALPLRLVSRLVTLDAFAKYTITMCEGDIYLLNQQNGRIRKGCQVSISDVSQRTSISRYPKPEHRVLNHKLRGRVKRILRALSSMVDFEIADTGGSHGRAVPIEGPLTPACSRRFAAGCRTKIRLNAKLVGDLAVSKFVNPGDYRRDALFVATTILHELSHAIGYAVDGLRFPEAYYKNSPYAERGA